MINKNSKTYESGDLITISINRKFPVVLREGPGYIYRRIDNLDPGQIGIILDTQLGHGSNLWIKIFIANCNVGWVPVGMVDKIKYTDND